MQCKWGDGTGKYRIKGCHKCSANGGMEQEIIELKDVINAVNKKEEERMQNE